MREVVIPNDFAPRPYQRRYMEYFDRGGKRAMWVVHRRGGKDLTALHQTVKMALQRVGAYWHVYPTFTQARKAIWEAFRSDEKRILDNAFPPEIVKRRNEHEMLIELVNGSLWRLLGSDRIEVVGAGPVGVVFSEYALAKPKAWELISPMLFENNGWASFITTPRGRNHAHKLYESARRDPAWFAEVQTLYDTRAYDPEATLAAERAAGKPEAYVRQEYLCDFTAANVGAIWGDLLEALEKRGGFAEFDHEQDGVFTSWDLGITDSTAIWFWRLRDGTVDVVDHYENHGKPLSHYFDEVEARPYKYVNHWLPHDARAKTLVSGTSVLEQCLGRFGAGAVAIAPSLSLLDGIQAARWLLQQPMRIHARCVQGIESLRAYHYEWDADSRSFAARPEHDWSSHTADAFRYLALVVKYSEQMTRKPPPKQALPYAVAINQTMKIDDMWAEHEGAR